MAKRGGMGERNGMAMPMVGLESVHLGEGVEEGVEELGRRGRRRGEDAVDDGGDGFGRDGAEAALEGGERHGTTLAAAPEGREKIEIGRAHV